MSRNQKGSFAKVLSQDSPKNTVRVAQLDKPKDQQSQASGDSKSMNLGAELSSFKEEMKGMILEMNKTITKNVSTNVTSSINNKIEELDSKFSAMFTEYKKTMFDFGGTGEQANVFQGNKRTGTPGRASVFAALQFV